MSKRPADIVISTPASKVRRRLNFDSPYATRAVVPTVRVTKSRIWANRPMYRKPRMYRMYLSPDVPKGCAGPSVVDAFDAHIDNDFKEFVVCLSDGTTGIGLTHRLRLRVCLKSLYFVGKVWMDDNINSWNNTNTVMFWIVRDRRPSGTPNDFQEVFNVYDNEPSTATVKNDQRDRFQVLRRFQATVTGGQYAAKEQAIIRKFYRVNNYVVYNHQEAGKYENHTENALLLYMACTHASNPVYATLKVRSYFYDSVTN
ncbi:coat protein [Hollyhock yellow vein mosaic virus]|uniref:Capsid protein n=1 Tax=Hollyhock yellow vein mosaic virus TaxID=944994 RepID=I0C065_9GEMI|nr:coat protein [Hollyhock yellow vein mosaic virus]AFH68194.1 coat protein [Hollyhock yellow vein mosaic virus]